VRPESRIVFAAIAAVVLAIAYMQVRAGDETRRAGLTTAEAAFLAASLANDECSRLFDRRPFEPDSYPVRRSSARFVWGHHDPAGIDGYSAKVSFSLDGADPEVKVYVTSDMNEAFY